MGIVYADIELVNTLDVGMARKNLIEKDAVKRLRTKLLVDSGAYMMAINETMQSQLELPFIEKRKVQTADGHVREYNVVGPVDVHFKNRMATCNAFVLPGDNEPLLGAIPMEEMDVLIHPQRQELIVNPEHPNYAVLKMK
jgi:clan AA aspartic protease